MCLRPSHHLLSLLSQHTSSELLGLSPFKAQRAFANSSYVNGNLCTHTLACAVILSACSHTLHLLKRLSDVSFFPVEVSLSSCKLYQTNVESLYTYLLNPDLTRPRCNLAPACAVLISAVSLLILGTTSLTVSHCCVPTQCPWDGSMGTIFVHL